MMEAVAHLAQCALHGSQTVRLSHAVMTAANVVELVTQSLDLLEVEVHGENLRKCGVYTAPDHLSPVHLSTQQK